MVIGAVSPQEIEQMEKEAEEDVISDDAGQRGQILWIRGLSRLQHQVCTLARWTLADRTTLNDHAAGRVMKTASTCMIGQ